MSRKQVSEKVSLDVYSLEGTVDEMVKKLDEAKQQLLSWGCKGEIQVFWDMDEYSSQLVLTGIRRENDEEYERRMKKVERLKASQKKAAQKRKANKEKEERKLLKKLQDKYGK